MAADSEFKSILMAALPVRIQNVADYVGMVVKQDHTFSFADCPNVAPPWKRAFFMWRDNNLLHGGDWDMGALIYGFDRQREPAAFKQAADAVVGGVPKGENIHDYLAAAYRSRWLTQALIFSRPHNDDAAMCWVNHWLADEHGQLVPREARDGTQPYWMIAGAPRTWPNMELRGRFSMSESSAMAVLLMAISFCHCKQVTIQTNPVPAQLLKKRQRSHDWTPEAWHEIAIAPMRQALREAGAETAGIGLRKALHITRGHWKDYREGRGLFGKYRGLYWWDFRLKDLSHPHRYKMAQH